MNQQNPHIDIIKKGLKVLIAKCNALIVETTDIQLARSIVFRKKTALKLNYGIREFNTLQLLTKSEKTTVLIALNELSRYSNETELENIMDCLDNIVQAINQHSTETEKMPTPGVAINKWKLAQFSIKHRYIS